MTWKEFFRPTISKITTTIILFVVLSLSYGCEINGRVGCAIGFPFSAWISGISGFLKLFSLTPHISALNLVFWYIIVSLIVLAYHKIRRK